jgi:hypothetical protein
MRNEDKKKDVESVLESFLLEDEVDTATFQRYLQQYPEFATELTDLAREIACISDYPNYAASEGDDALLAQAWGMHADAAAWWSTHGAAIKAAIRCVLAKSKHAEVL